MGGPPGVPSGCPTPAVSPEQNPDQVAGMNQMDSEQLARFVAGQASAAEQAEVGAWAASDRAHRIELDRLRVIWGAKPTPATWNIDVAWTSVAARLDSARPEVEVIPIRRPMMPWLAAAAALLVAGGGAAWFLRTGPSEVAYQTAIGQQRTVDLADGSRVILAPASTLTVHAGFGRKERTLTLTGQAWFEVEHDARRPFRVQVGDVTVEDLGTDFEIEAHTAEIRVAVARGSVAVHASANAAPVQLAAGDLATVTVGGQGTVSHQAPVERLTSWRRGTLAFEDRSLNEVAEELRHWYAISFALRGDVGSRRLNATIPTGRLDDALETIATALDLKQTRNGQTVTFAPKGVP